VKKWGAVYRCSFEPGHKDRLLEVPQWMFESAVCCRLHVAETPVVSCEACSICRYCCAPPDSLMHPLCYKLSIAAYRHQVVMRKLLSAGKVPQIELFRTAPKSPRWEGIPQEVRQKTVKLLAQLLGEHWGRVFAQEQERCND
jgi:hypothetical protein